MTSINLFSSEIVSKYFKCFHHSISTALCRIAIMHWSYCSLALIHWGWVTQICVSELTINGSDKGLSLSRRPAIIWTNAGILWTGPAGTNFSEITCPQNLYIFIQENPFENVVWKMAAILFQPQCVKPSIWSYSYHLQHLRHFCFSDTRYAVVIGLSLHSPGA